MIWAYEEQHPGYSSLRWQRAELIYGVKGCVVGGRGPNWAIVCVQSGRKHTPQKKTTALSFSPSSLPTISLVSLPPLPSSPPPLTAVLNPPQ